MVEGKLLMVDKRENSQGHLQESAMPSLEDKGESRRGAGAAGAEKKANMLGESCWLRGSCQKKEGRSAGICEPVWGSDLS